MMILRTQAATSGRETTAMSTTPVSTALSSATDQQYFQQRSADLKQLEVALQSGNLTDAENAYNAIVTLGKSGPFSNGVPFEAKQREQDFQVLGQALQSGNLAEARQAFAALKSTFQSQGSAPSGGAGVGPATIVDLSISSGS
jgi:hypothetical protein